jgi:hypothetical protein
LHYSIVLSPPSTPFWTSWCLTIPYFLSHLHFVKSQWVAQLNLLLMKVGQKMFLTTYNCCSCFVTTCYMWHLIFFMVFNIFWSNIVYEGATSELPISVENWKNIKGKESKKDKSSSRFSRSSTLFKPFQSTLYKFFM